MRCFEEKTLEMCDRCVRLENDLDGGGPPEPFAVVTSGERSRQRKRNFHFQAKRICIFGIRSQF